MNHVISKRERYIVAIDYILWFWGMSILDLLIGMSKNTEFMAFHHKQAIRIGKFILIGVGVFALFLVAHILFTFPEKVITGYVVVILLYLGLYFFFTFKGIYYALKGQTKKVF